MQDFSSLIKVRGYSFKWDSVLPEIKLVLGVTQLISQKYVELTSLIQNILFQLKGRYCFQREGKLLNGPSEASVVYDFISKNDDLE